MATTQVADFTFVAGDYDADVLRVTNFHGVEGMSRLGGFRIDLASEDADVDLDALVGEKACLSWRGVEETRHVHGIISRFEITGHGQAFTYYSAQLVPRMWLLTRRSQSRIFQNTTTPDILKKVFEEGGLPTDQFKISVKRSYKPRKYCVQYRESDMDFASRLMEEEGIFYWFEHDEEGHTLILADDTSAYTPVTGESTFPFRPGDLAAADGEVISSFRYRCAVRTGLVTMRDFDFKKPSLDLTTDSPAEKWKVLERYEYPGRFPDQGTGKDLVKIRLEEEQVGREIVEGHSNCRMLTPAHTWTLEGFGRDSLNQDYLLTEVRHFGRQPQAAVEDASLDHAEEGPSYTNEFEGQPASVVFRPARVTPRPRVEGPQTAIVTGPKGEEIHTDEYGRVKVRFPWDRSGITDDKSSCWIRVSQGWSGAGWGGIYIPRIGQEVIVEFLEGDPDRPLITGRVYNGESPPPYGLPGAKTQSTIKSNSSPGGGGSNEIRFEDAAGSEEVFVHAQKDMNQVVGNDRTKKVGRDEKFEVGNDQTGLVKRNQTLTVNNNRDKTVKVDQSETIGGNKKIDVTGSHTEAIHGSKKVNVTLGHTETVNAYQSITVGAARMLKVGAAFTQTIVGLKSTTVGAALKIKVSRNYEEKVNGNRTTQIKKNYDEKVKGTHTENVDGDFVLHAKNIELMAEEKMFISVGGKAMVTLHKDGKIEVEGKDMTLKGKELKVDGSKMDTKISGDITTKASNIKQN